MLDLIRLPDFTGIKADIDSYLDHEEAHQSHGDKGPASKYHGEGGGSPEDIQKALGHYADTHKRKLDKPITAEEAGTNDETQLGALNLKREYIDEKNIKAVENKKLVGDLNNPENRLAVLSRLTQTGEDKNATDLAECGPSSLIGGALLAGGTDGLKDIMDATLAHCDPKHKEKLGEEMEQINKAMKEGKLNFGHLQALQKNLYTVMQRDMEGENPDVIKEYLDEKKKSGEESDATKAKGAAAGKTGGINSDTIKDFLATSPELMKRFKENGLSVAHIDTDAEKDGYGRNDAEHFVLHMKNKEGKDKGFYDPWQRKHGQLVTQAEEVKQYSDARIRTIDGEP